MRQKLLQPQNNELLCCFVFYLYITPAYRDLFEPRLKALPECSVIHNFHFSETIHLLHVTQSLL